MDEIFIIFFFKVLFLFKVSINQLAQCAFLLRKHWINLSKSVNNFKNQKKRRRFKGCSVGCSPKHCRIGRRQLKTRFIFYSSLTLKHSNCTVHSAQRPNLLNKLIYKTLVKLPELWQYINYAKDCWNIVSLINVVIYRVSQ